MVSSGLRGFRPFKPIDEGLDLPGHIKNVNVCEWRRIITELMGEQPRKRVTELIQLMARTAASAPPTSKQTRITDDDFAQLLRFGVARPAPDDARVNLVLRRRAERAKGRARILGWPDRANTCMAQDYSCQMRLRDVTEIVKVSKTFALTFDLSCSFWQLDAMAEFVFVWRGRKYFFTRLLMGATTSAEIMHTIVLALSDVSDQYPAVHRDVHIDNVRYLSDNYEELEAVRQIIQSRLLEYKVQVNDPLCVSTRHEFFGLHFDSQADTVALSSKHMAKLHMFQTLLQQDQLTLHDALHILGTMIFLARALGDPLAEHYTAIQLLRQLAREFNSQVINLDSPIRITTHQREHLLAWVMATLANPARKIPAHNQQCFPTVLFCDAQPHGWGAVLIKNNTVHIAAGRFTDSSHINIKELKTVEIALGRFSSLLAGDSIHLAVDNTAALYVAKKGFSGTWSLNKTAYAINNKLRAIHASFAAVEYVPSPYNPADPPSRQLPITGKPLHLLHRILNWSYTGAQGGFRPLLESVCRPDSPIVTS